jgi:radical SAM superfamily enzyme YgiQ (UPF0313 family)
MDVILFNPPRYRDGSHPKFNNALMWLASYLRDRGVDVRVVPLADEHFEETVRREIEEHRPRHVGISCKWWDTLYASTFIASLVKKCDPEIITVAGGHTATFFSKDLVEQTDVDVVIRGDGEEPLYRLVAGQDPMNCVSRESPHPPPPEAMYVQDEASLRDIRLVDDPGEVLSNTSMLNGFVWTGKGCGEACVYCAGNAWNSYCSFGRTGCIYRPVDVVTREIDILSTHAGSSRIILDYDPLSPEAEKYHLELFDNLEPHKYNTYFCCWSLPSERLIDRLADTFNFIELCIDVQTCSERLRRRLGDEGCLKPYFPNEALERALECVSQHDNFIVDLSGLMGLPFETEEDVEAIRPFSDYLYDKYEDLRYPYISPMNVEPGSLVMRAPDRFDMVLFRRDFSDFMEYTRRSFEDSVNCYQPEAYGEGVFHPLGACPRADFESGDTFRVYERWKIVQEYIDRRSEEKSISRMRKYRRYGLVKAGVQGGIDRPTLARFNVE